MKIGIGCALVVVDAQRDFVSGSLPVPGAYDALEKVDALVEKFYHARLPRAYTACKHPREHVSFASTFHLPPFTRYEGRVLWPDHCVAGTIGEHIIARVMNATDPVFFKGTEKLIDSYSGFGGATTEGLKLAQWLENEGAQTVVICGLATDYCVKHTALDAVALGLDVVVVVDAIAATSESSRITAMEELRAKGVRERTERWIEVIT